MLGSEAYLAPGRLVLIGAEYGGQLALRSLPSLASSPACVAVTQPTVDWTHHGQEIQLVCLEITVLPPALLSVNIKISLH